MGYSREELLRQLSELGVKQNDSLVVYASIPAMGEIDGGAKELLGVLIDYLKYGLLIIPTHSWMEVTVRNPVFDVNKTTTCLGTLSLLALQDKRGFRSLHPTYSMTVFGVGAETYIQGEENCTTPTPPNGCWGRLADINAKVLTIGAGQEKNFFLHAAEEALKVPDRLTDKPIELVVRDAKGRESTVMMKEFKYSRGVEVERNYSIFELPFAMCGALEYGKVGDARAQLTDVRRSFDILRKIYSRADRDICREPIIISSSWYKD